MFYVDIGGSSVSPSQSKGARAIFFSILCSFKRKKLQTKFSFSVEKKVSWKSFFSFLCTPIYKTIWNVFTNWSFYSGVPPIDIVDFLFFFTEFGRPARLVLYAFFYTTDTNISVLRFDTKYNLPNYQQIIWRSKSRFSWYYVIVDDQNWIKDKS